jgi:hypothetical protein
MKKDNSTLILLLLAGFGIYWYYKKQKPTTVNNTSNTYNNTIAPDTSMAVPNKTESDVNIRYTINGMKKYINCPNTI